MANVRITEVLANGAVYANGYYGTGIANNYTFRSEQYVNQTGSANNRFVDVYNLQMTTYASAPATLYFYNYNSADRIEIYQGNTLLTDISHAVPLTPADKAFVLSDSGGNFFSDSPDLYLKDFVLSTINGASYAAYAGKITWTHNPAQGATYTVRTSKGDGSFDWRYILEYPIDGLTIGCPPIAPVYVPPPPPVIVMPTGGGGGCGCKIACTAMNDAYGFGGFRQKIWLAEANNLSPEHQTGYHFLFLPLVSYCYYSESKDTIVARSLKFLLERVVRARTRDLWKRRRGSYDAEGSAYRKVFEPICRLAGLLVKDK